jgi:antitoxin ParD1/3/4
MPSSYTLGSRYEALVRKLVDSGRYASQSEVLRDGLRLLEDREERREARLDALRQAIRSGIDSGPGLSADEVFDRLSTRYSTESRD